MVVCLYLEEIITGVTRVVLSGGRRSMRLITVGLDKLVEIGMYPSRSEAIRVAIRDLLRRELWPRDGGPILMNDDTESQ
jgi:hypothetical protein